MRELRGSVGGDVEEVLANGGRLLQTDVGKGRSVQRGERMRGVGCE